MSRKPSSTLTTVPNPSWPCALHPWCWPRCWDPSVSLSPSATPTPHRAQPNSSVPKPNAAPPPRCASTAPTTCIPPRPTWWPLASAKFSPVQKTWLPPWPTTIRPNASRCPSRQFVPTHLPPFTILTIIHPHTKEPTDAISAGSFFVMGTALGRTPPQLPCRGVRRAARSGGRGANIIAMPTGAATKG